MDPRSPPTSGLAVPSEPPPGRAPWHAMTPEACLELLVADARLGLGEEEARRRLEKHGRNELAEAAPIRPLAILLAQFKSIMVAILIAAGIVAGVTGEWADCLAILAIVVLNALIGFYQEYHAEKSIAALRRMTA